MSIIDERTVTTRMVEERTFDMTGLDANTARKFVQTLTDDGWKFRYGQPGKYTVYTVYRVISEVTRVEGDTHAI